LIETFPLSSSLALLAAFGFATGAHVLSLAMRDLDSRTCSMINIFGSLVPYLVLAPFFVESSWWFTAGALVFASIGLFRPLFSSNLANAGNKLLGPTRQTTLSATTPLFGITMGVLFLNEKLTLPVVAGAALVVIGILIIATRKREGATGGGKPKDDWPWWALLLPIGAAFFRALAQLFTKFGLLLVPSPFFAGMLSYGVSFALALGTDMMRETPVRERIRSRGTKYALIGGAINGLAILALNSALHHGKLIEVAPITACSPVFTLIMSWLIFRREKLGIRLVLAVAFVVPGVALVSLVK